MGNDYLGHGGRLTSGPSPELVRAGFAAESAHGPGLADGLSRADLAHAIVLAESGSVDPETARALLRGLLELDAIAPGDFPWDPQIGDAFNAREHELRERVGARPAGWLSAGRPRREAFRVALRLVAAEGALALHHHLVAFADALCDQAERHANDLTADYTYLVPAQPTTIGHLLLGVAAPALRDAERLRAAHARLNQSVAGAGGSAGSRWPLDRARLADLLGAEGIVTHARDAAWQADAFVELAAAVATQAAHASQFAQDLEILASQEFGVVELAEGHSRTSALMPQKRNPYALPIIRAGAATAAGDLTTILTALHTGSARTDHFHVLNGLIPRMLDEATANASLTAAVAAGLTFDTQAAARPAFEGFVTAADVADLLASECGLDYRSAHTAIGRAVRDLVEDHLPMSALTPERLADACAAAIGERPVIRAEALASALDPRACLATRLQPGGAAPERVQELLVEARAEVVSARQWAVATAARAVESDQALRARAHELAT